MKSIIEKTIEQYFSLNPSSKQLIINLVDENIFLFYDNQAYPNGLELTENSIIHKDFARIKNNKTFNENLKMLFSAYKTNYPIKIFINYIELNPN